MIRNKVILLTVGIVVSACATYSEIKFTDRYGTPQPRERQVAQLPPDSVDYWNEVKPVLENRCVVCHGCYDAPCQLKLGSIEGLERGASSAVVYQQSRIKSATPTRLFEDAQTVEEWRELGFYGVLNEYPDSPESNRLASVMHRILTLKEENPLPADKILDDSFEFDLGRDQVCATPATFDKYATQHPLWGMPYALPAIEPEQQATLLEWLEQGAVYTPRVPLDEDLVAAVARWEMFLNADSPKAQLAARYIYEHLFLTHLYFPAIDDRQFFRIVRSATPPGQPVDVIATRRPYNDPSVERVYYRISRELGAIVSKTHMPYALTAERMADWRTWFIDAPYDVSEMPSYESQFASNPFRTFDVIPVHSRYRFLLDEAQNTINSFIKGPVCRGQVALNVINDHFWVFFVNPDDPNLEILEDFLARQLENTELPASSESTYRPITHWRRYSKQQKALITAQDAYLSEYMPLQDELTLDVVWDGDGENDNAALTVFRHFDSATVEKGLVGRKPKTAWLISYALLERIHYLLVAGYDVYGNVSHQLLTRVYMDFLRMEGEANFLLMLPQAARDQERANWYRGAHDEITDFMVFPRFESRLAHAISYTTDNPKSELFDLLRQRLQPVLPTTRELAALGDNDIEQALAPLEDLQGGAVTLVPQTVFLEIRSSEGSRYLTIVRNNAHLNITSMFGENKFRVPDEDTLSVVTGFLGSYPNALWAVDKGDLGQFVSDLSSLQDEDDYERFMDAYGIRRSNPGFWQQSDAIHSAYETEAPIEYGLFDFNRLENR